MSSDELGHLIGARRPPLSRYDLCPDDSGWVYRYAGEE